MTRPRLKQKNLVQEKGQESPPPPHRGTKAKTSAFKLW